jgi:glycosyltransferase involved in cell wall biosynthesis
MRSLKVGLALCSQAGDPLPSTRIAILNMLPALAAENFSTPVVFEPAQPSETPDLTGVAQRAIESGCDIVILQKLRGPNALDLVRKLAEANLKTVYVTCDHVDHSMVDAADATVVVTDFLKSLCPANLQSRIHVVHDGIEREELCKTRWRNGLGKRQEPLCAVLVSSSELTSLPILGKPPDWLNIRLVGRYATGHNRWRQSYWSWQKMPWPDRSAYLRFLFNGQITCVPWDKEGVYHELAQADIAIIPVDTAVVEPGHQMPSWKLKSENRLTMKMAMGLPVIATPIPSYEPVITNGVDGFLARTQQDWQICLDALRDTGRRKEMGLAARASVLKRYSRDLQAKKLIEVLRGVCAGD